MLSCLTCPLRTSDSRRNIRPLVEQRNPIQYSTERKRSYAPHGVWRAVCIPVQVIWMTSQCQFADKIVPVHASDSYLRCQRELSDHLHLPAALPTMKRAPRYVLYEATWIPESLCGRLEKRKFPFFCRDRTTILDGHMCIARWNWDYVQQMQAVRFSVRR
jgi:hypothetical protein